MITSGLVAVGIVIVIATVTQTIKLTKGSKRTCKYLNLKSTSEKQKKHDDHVLDDKEKREYYKGPNPSRNYTEIMKIQSKMQTQQVELNYLKNTIIGILSDNQKEGTPLLAKG